MTDEPGLPLPGYKPQSQENLAAVREGKYLEERLLRYLDQLGASGRAQDALWLEFGRGLIQMGCMAVYRSVMAPGRTTLPEDETVKTKPGTPYEKSPDIQFANLPQPMRPVDD